MKTQYIFHCSECNTQNELFRFSCKNCGTTFHNKIANLEFTSVLPKLIESPQSGFIEIIQAEHKNFIYLLLALVSVKVLINLHLLFPLQIGTSMFSLFQQLVISFIILTAFLFLSSIIIVKVLSNNILVRIRDVFAVIIYAHTSMVFALILFFPLEIILFGEFLFSRNPDPFFVRTTFAYTFATLEVLTLIWQVILMKKGIKIFFGSRIISLLASVIIIVIVHSILFLFLILA